MKRITHRDILMKKSRSSENYFDR